MSIRGYMSAILRYGIISRSDRIHATAPLYSPSIEFEILSENNDLKIINVEYPNKN
jgi:hypothetical protein